jgi:integral membrane protein (TIGR00529 family)
VNPSIVLLISIASILVLLRLKVHPGPAVFVGGLVLSLLVLPARETPVIMFKTVTSLETIRLIGIIIAALTLSKLMELRGLLVRLAHTLETIGPKLAIHIVPSVIGMVPMPGGALVSATAVKGLVRRLGLSPAQATYVNFWFRHTWELSVPVYPGVIAASAVLSVPLSTVVLTMLPSIPLFLAIGGLVSYRMLRTTTCEAPESLPFNVLMRQLVIAAWPVIVLVGMVLAGVEAAIAFVVAGILLAIQQRASRKEIVEALKYGFGPKVLFLLYSVMLYKAIVEQSGAAYALFADMQSIGMPTAVILMALPMLIGLATGLSVAFVGISFTLLLPFMTSGGELNSLALFLAYIGGGLGYMVSPLHLCLILSAEFFEARLADIYRIMIPPLIGVLGAALAAYLIAA